MQGRSRGKKDLPEDKPGFRTSGDVTPSGILPSYDAPHRRFSKRRRVWVIGDDGKVVKVWKEGKDGKESPDSGLEDEDEGGDKVDGKYVGKFGKRGVDKGHRDFLKQFGRQDIKDPEELKEKGDMHKASSKLMAKVKRMAGFRAFSRASTRARSHRSRGGKNQDRDRDGSAYRQSGTISEASYDSEVDSRVVLGEKEQNKLNELSEKQLKEGLKNSGDKGRDSPDSGTGRDSALSSHSSAYSNDNDERGGGDGGKRDRSRRSRRDKDGKGSSAGKDGKGRHSGDSTGRGGGGEGSQGGGKGGDNGKGGAGGSGGGVGGSGGDRSGGGGDGHGGAGGSGTGGGSTGGSDGGSGGGDGSRSRSRGGGGGQGGEANDAGDGSGRGGDTAFRDGRGSTDTIAGSSGGRSEGRRAGGAATAWGVGSGEGGGSGGGGGAGAAWRPGSGGGGGRGGSGGGGDINSSTETLNRNDSARPGGPGQDGGSSHPGSEPASRGRPRDSKRRMDNVRSQISSFASTRDDVTLPSMSSGFLGSDYDTSTPMDTAGGRSGDRGGKSGARVAIGGKESQEDLYYGAGHSNMIIVTPRDGEVQGEDRRHRGKGQGDQEGGAAINGQSKRGGRSKQNFDDSVESAIDLNDPFTAQAPAVVLESGRPPTGHQQRRHGWQAGDRSRSRSPPKPTEDERTKSQVARSYSDRLTDSRSVHWQGSQAEVSVPGTADPAGRRSVRWKEDGGSQGNTLMVPVTPGMAVRRHPDSDGAASSLSRQSRPYSSMSRLARIHRKKKAVAPIEDQDYEQDPRARLQRPPDMDDLAWKRLLEELYPDKKYLDYAKATSSDETNERFLNIKAGEGLHYLYDRAKFWKAQDPLVRPGTNMSVRSIDSRAPSAVPPRGL